MKNYKEVIEKLNEGVKFGNNNTDFFINEGVYLMCEYTKDCKYSTFANIEKFAKRILKFTKTGY